MASSKTKTPSEPHCPAVPPPTRRKSLMASVAETQLLPAAPPDQAITRTQRGNGHRHPVARTSIPTTDPLLSERELAERWGWSPRSLQRRRWLGLPPAYVKVGRSVRYRLSIAEAFLQDGGGNAPAP
jgi:hypothetical protein